MAPHQKRKEGKPSADQFADAVRPLLQRAPAIKNIKKETHTCTRKTQGGP